MICDWVGGGGGRERVRERDREGGREIDRERGGRERLVLVRVCTANQLLMQMTCCCPT